MKYKATGFTLIEVLVVLFLIGIILSFASFSFSSRDSAQHIAEDVQRLHQLLKLGQEEAIVKQRLVGLAFTPKGYQFLQWREGQWQALMTNPTDTASVWRPRQWQQPWDWSLDAEGETWTAEEVWRERSFQFDEAASPLTAHLLLYPDGTLSAFTLTINTHILTGDALETFHDQSTAVHYRLHGSPQGQFDYAMVTDE